MRPWKWLVILVLALLVGVASAKKLSFVLDTTDNRADEAQAIASQLQQIGVDVQVRVWKSGVLLDAIKAGSRQAYTTDWGSAYFDPFDLGIPKLTTGGRGNYSFYSNPQVDEDFQVASTTTSDAPRAAAYKDAQKRISSDAPWIFGYVLKNIEASSSSVRGWQPAADNAESMAAASVQGGNAMVIGMRTDQIITFDPAMYRDRDTEAVLRNMFDSLVTHTPSGDVVPQLATSWTKVDDKTYDFTLHSGVTFQNGDPLTADDVVYTFHRILTPGAVNGDTSPRAGLLGPIDHVEKIDATHVRFVYKDPFPESLLLQALVHFQIVPMAYMEKVGVEGFKKAPIGSGPFQFERGSLDSQIVLKRFDNYWAGPAKLSQVVFRMMPEPSTRVAALLSGEVQIIQAVPPDLVPRLQSAPNIDVKTAEGTRAYQIELNNKLAPFNDVRVRQALNLAVDWNSILKNIYHGYAERLPTAFLPSGFGYDSSLQPYPYDPARAKELLLQAGYDGK